MYPVKEHGTECNSTIGVAEREFLNSEMV